MSQEPLIIVVTGSRALEVSPWGVLRSWRGALAEIYQGYHEAHDRGGSPPPRFVLRHGAARGVDILVANYETGEGTALRIESYPVSQFDWEIVGRSAGHRRNAAMLEGVEGRPKADWCICIWDGASSGAGGCKAKAHELGIPVVERVVTMSASLTSRQKVRWR